MRSYALTRMQTAKGAWHWRVSFSRRGTHYQRRFYETTYGGNAGARKAAVAWRDEQLARLSALGKLEFCQQERSNNTSGVPGVQGSHRSGILERSPDSEPVQCGCAVGTRSRSWSSRSAPARTGRGAPPHRAPSVCQSGDRRRSPRYWPTGRDAFRSSRPSRVALASSMGSIPSLILARAARAASLAPASVTWESPPGPCPFACPRWWRAVSSCGRRPG